MARQSAICWSKAENRWKNDERACDEHGARQAPNTRPESLVGRAKTRTEHERQAKRISISKRSSERLRGILELQTGNMHIQA